MIEITDLTFAYQSKAKVLDHFNLSFETGQITGLLGRNGAGKSTILRLLAGLLKPLSGTIKVFDETPFERRPQFLQNVFYVPDEDHLPTQNIRKYVKLLTGFYPNFDSAKFSNICNEFDVSPHGNISTYSFGMRKKIVIAIALASNCKLILLDEPTNGLDIPSKVKFRKIIASETREDQSVIISTHQVKEVESLIDSIIIVDDGRCIVHKSLFDLSNELQCTVQSSPSKHAIYSEICPGGYKVIESNGGHHAPIDLEILFNAVYNGVNI